MALNRSVEAFFQQQIELYGDELILSLERSQAPDPQDDHVDPNWIKSSDLPSLYENINHCMRCTLGRSRNKFVFGSGNPNADVMLIGEAPDNEEDKQGFPFVGQAGQLLDKILNAIHLDRTQVYLCNVVKCHPPENRMPLLTELNACYPFLIKQIELVNPRIVLCMGESPAQTLLQSQNSLEELRARVHQVDRYQIIVTHHPAYLLRHPEFKRDTWFDVQLLEQHLEQKLE